MSAGCGEPPAPDSAPLSGRGGARGGEGTLKQKSGGGTRHAPPHPLVPTPRRGCPRGGVGAVSMLMGVGSCVGVWALLPWSLTGLEGEVPMPAQV